MNFCPHCGERLNGNAHNEPLENASIIVPPSMDKDRESPEVLARLRPKLADLVKRIDAMSEDEYGDWVDALPFDEFVAFIGLTSDEQKFRAVALGAANG